MIFSIQLILNLTLENFPLVISVKMIPHASAAKVLLKELKNLTETPLEGFQILNAEECNVYEWDIAIFGPPNTQFAGGYFKAKIKFPGDYPFNPPSFRFQSKVFHPNIYENGEVCIKLS